MNTYTAGGRHRNALFTGVLCAALISSVQGFSQNAEDVRRDMPESFREFERMFVTPAHYVVARVAEPPLIDGNINERAWESAAWTDEFQDIEGCLSSRPKPAFATRAKMLWDKDYLYIAAQLDEKHVWATLDQHDQIVFHDNDFEIFIDPRNTTHTYFEIEINALNTIFDLYLPKPYQAGGNPLIAWDSRGLKHAVEVQGMLNDASDEDRGWTVEMAIPFASLDATPRDRSLWRINFSRVEWDTHIQDGKYVKMTGTDGKPLPENNWVWSPQGVIDMHRPERWGYLLFTDAAPDAQLPVFEMPYAELQRQWLWLVFYKQRQYMMEHRRYAASLHELGLDSSVHINGMENTLTMEATSFQFTAFIAGGNDAAPISINNEGLVTGRGRFGR